MKKIATISKTFSFLFILLFLFNQTDINACGCKCGTQLVKFVWESGQFVPVGGDSKGITITNVITKVGQPNKPIKVYWTSADWYICAVEIKHGRRYRTTYYNPPAISGENCTPSCYAISQIIFCADEPLPVEMSSFSATLNNNLTQLDWETATEVNNYGFEVERSCDTKAWKNVGFVEGHGNSNSPKYYSFTDNSVFESGQYYYRLKQIDIDGQYEYSDMVSVELTAPDGFALNQNYPNPFNPSTTISYSLPLKSDVKLIVYDLFGQEVSRLVDQNQEAGNYAINFDGSRLASGVYIYTIKTNQFSATKRLILMK